MIGKLLMAVVGSIFVLLIVSAGPLVWMYDRAEPGWPNLHLHVAFVHWTFHLPDSLGAKLAKLETAEAAALAHTHAVEAKDAQIGADAAQHDQTAQAAIQVRYRTLIKEVPTYVTAAIDLRYPVSLGSVRVFNAGASGLGMSAFPLGPGQSDADAATTSASALAAAILANDQICRANAQSLTDLQGWVRDAGMAAK